jgi:parallel beta-helix repeat protein
MMKKKHFYKDVILVVFLAIGIQPVLAVINIPGDTSYYTMDGTHTYVLNQDVSDTIQITSDGITLDGSGHTISGVTSGTGLKLDGRLDVNIQNLTITGCGTGIDIITSARINVMNNSVTYCQWGINLRAAGTCTIGGNIVSDSSNTGIFLGRANDVSSVNNDLYNNTIKDNHFGIGIDGISLPVGHPEYINEIYNNNFINNTGSNASVVGSQPEANVFNLDLPTGGNYWSDYPGEDTDGDGIGEATYTFTGGQDGFPWIIPNGWSNQPPIADAGPDQTVEQDSPAGASVTLDGSGSSDDPIQPLTYTWTWAGGGLAMDVNPTVALPVGTTTVTLTVYDGVLSGTDTVDITVQSVEPPEDAPEDVVEDIIDYIELMDVPEKAEKEMNKAVKELNKAIKEFNKDRIDKAIKKISKAVKRLEKAQTKGADAADIQGVIDELVDLVQGL